MTVTQVAMSVCDTIYDVDGVRLRLWIITGGTPAVAFENYGFTQRYPAVERWSNKHWKGHCYDHQDPARAHLQGPTAAEVLPDGEDTLYQFVREYLPKLQLRMKRFEALPTRNLKSRRFHDRDECLYFRASVEFRPHYIGCVILDSRFWTGRINDRDRPRMEAQGPNAQSWLALADTLDRYDTPHRAWEDLTEDQFQEIVAALEAVT